MGVHPQGVVKVPGPVQGQAHQELIFSEKVRPLRREGHAVGLDRVVHRDPGGDEFLLHGNKIPEKVQPRQGGLAPLEGDLDDVSGLGGGPQQVLGGLAGHDAHALGLPALGHVLVEAVAAAQAAQAGGRLH